ncbi:MAG: ATP synthase F1 subunit delta [Alphaproteobacteria bacterium]|jgi:F-type H+-transporting ATPase subunit delta|nr:ATP synthase F1 subunit delta [Alphaproteobacteria bacterium]
MINLELERDLKKYSTALLDLAKGQNLLDQVNTDMQVMSKVFATIYSSKKDAEEYKEVGKKFLVTSNAKQTEIIKNILKELNISKLVSNFVLLLLISKKITILRHLVESWDSLFLTYKGYFKVSISSVIPLSESQEQKIKEIITKSHGDKFFLEKKIDPAILGGLVIHLKNQVIDDSLASKIKKIENNVRGTI